MRSQELADSFYDIAFVLSVEKTSDGGYGDIRIEAANGKAAELIGAAPVPGTLYDGYMPRDLNFEDRCFRAAVIKEPVHSYIRTSKEDKWLNVFVIPVDYEDRDICRCVYTARLCTVDKIDFSSAFSSETSEDVLKTCIKLHGTDDFKRTLAEVIKDIRLICRAEVCTTMLVDHSTGTCSVLATSIRENSTIKRVTQFVNFYDIANSWLKTIGDSDCLIIKSEKSECCIISRSSLALAGSNDLVDLDGLDLCVVDLDRISACDEAADCFVVCFVCFAEFFTVSLGDSPVFDSELNV